MIPSTLEFRSASSTGDVTRSPLSTVSNLNLSDHAISGRHSSWSKITMISTIVISPHVIAVQSPCDAAVCRYDPSPGSRKFLAPTGNISHTIRKNQPLATDTIEFHTRPIAPNGSSSWNSRCQREKRLISVASISSRGMLFSEV